MSAVRKSLSLNNGAAVEREVAKRGRFDRCFSFMEISVEPGKSVKDMDSNKLKAEIKRWAKAVVAYARQVSGRFAGGSTGSWSTCYIWVNCFLIAAEFSRLVIFYVWIEIDQFEEIMGWFIGFNGGGSHENLQTKIWKIFWEIICSSKTLKKMKGAAAQAQMILYKNSILSLPSGRINK